MKFDIEAQDIEPGKAYTDGDIVFTAAKVRPTSDHTMVIVTKRGRRILAGNSVKVASVKD